MPNLLSDPVALAEESISLCERKDSDQQNVYSAKWGFDHDIGVSDEDVTRRKTQFARINAKINVNANNSTATYSPPFRQFSFDICRKGHLCIT